MASIPEDRELVPSVLDRLIDDEPNLSREMPKPRNQVLYELKKSVCRDLENLLNTRWRSGEVPSGLTELQASLVNYGLPDFTGTSMANHDERQDFCRIIQQTIERFEPRFKKVTVEMQRNSEETDRTLRFRIDALLYAEPAPEPIVFDSQMEPVNGVVEVKVEG